MDVLVVDVEREVARLNAVFDVVEAPLDKSNVIFRDDTLLTKHTRMGLRSRDILRVQRLINWKRGAEALGELADVLGETT